MVKKNTFVPVQDLAGNFVIPEKMPTKKRGRPPKKEENISMVINEIKKRGRPKKYSTTEEARKAKIANTIASAKKRKGKGASASIVPSPDEESKMSEEDEASINSLLNEAAAISVRLDDYDEWLDTHEDDGNVAEDEYLRVLRLQLTDTQRYNNIIQSLDRLGYRTPSGELTGTGIISSVKKLANKVKDTASAIIYGRSDYPPKVRNIISKYGDKNITGIILGRTPLGTPLMTSLQVASGNTFSQKLQNTPYDKLFHLFMCVELAGGKIVLEKNEVINAEIGCKLPKETETKIITSSDIPPALTLNDALEKTKQRMGGNFFTYSAKDNNCQDFIVAFLTANNIGTETDKSWVKQETKVLFEGNDRLRKIANTFTDIGARVDVLRQGAGTKIKKGGKVPPPDRSNRAILPPGVVLPPPPPPPPIPPPPVPAAPRVTQRRRFGMPPPFPDVGRGIRKRGGKIGVTDIIPNLSAYAWFMDLSSATQYEILRKAVNLVNNSYGGDLKQTLAEMGGWGGLAETLRSVLAPQVPVITKQMKNKFKRGGVLVTPPGTPPTPPPTPPSPIQLGMPPLTLDSTPVQLYNFYTLLYNAWEDSDKGQEEINQVSNSYNSFVDYNPEVQHPQSVTQLIMLDLFHFVASVENGEDFQEEPEALNYYYGLLNVDMNEVTPPPTPPGTPPPPNPNPNFPQANLMGDFMGEGLGKKKSVIKKKSNSNTKMANPWIEYVKAYAKKNNMKYNEALKDPKMKAGYKKGGAMDTHSMPDGTMMTGKTHTAKSRKVGGKFNAATSAMDVLTKLGQPYKEVTGLNPATFGYDLGHDVIGPALYKAINKGKGIPSSRDAYIAELYDQANLGANGKVRLN